MVDEKLSDLIQKYGIYDSIADWILIQKEKKHNRFISAIIGLLYLSKPLNKALDSFPSNNVALCGEYGSFLLAIWWLIRPRNRKRIQFIVTDTTCIDNFPDEFHGRQILGFNEMGQQPVCGYVVVSQQSSWYADVLNGFGGTIVDVRTLICDNHLGRFFEGVFVEDNPYADIFIAAKQRGRSYSTEMKQLWHQRLIAHYVRIRDFLSTHREINAYITAGYENAKQYLDFWREVEGILSYVKHKLENREKKDIIIHWLDQMEKEDFFSMRWVGSKEKGMIFHRAYTTMTNTRPVVFSIFTGKNVKDGNLIKPEELDIQNTIFKSYPSMNREVHIFSNIFNSYFSSLKEVILHDCYANMGRKSPTTLGLWHMIDVMLESAKDCLFFVHSMETHNFYCSPVAPPMMLDYMHKPLFDYSEDAKKSRDYLDSELEWYHQLFSPKSIVIYMSDHGNYGDLREKDVNMPFKIMGAGILPGNEERLFSYKDIYKLIEGLFSSKVNTESVFSNEVIIDLLDPYSESFMKSSLCYWSEHFIMGYQELEKDELKRTCLQTTKIVTDEGEYYTINILGEETYYRDEECEVNLAGNPAYATRIKELRERAGKFYNPWKENRQVAIDFYEYLGIKEEDIVAQCY